MSRSRQQHFVPTKAQWARIQRIEADAIKYPLDPRGYAERVRELEHEGLTTSDAQGAADVEFAAQG